MAKNKKMKPEIKAALQLFQFSGGSTGDADDNSNNQILSKNWRHNWCRLSQLKLDQTLWETTDEFISPTVRFTNVFYHILALHAGSISKFILSIVDPLRHLTLQRCLVRPPPVFRGLISLELSQVTISTEDFGNFISRCLLLEHLVLDHSDNANNIEINAPKLRSFARNYDLVAFFKSIPALEHLHWDYIKVAWALCLLPYLEELEIKGPGHLSGELIEYVPWWTVDEIPADVTYNYLRTVKIKGVVGAGVDMQIIKVLLAKSPVLLRMVIDPYVEGDHSLAKITKYQRASPQAEVIYNVNAYPGYKPA
ncbi:hypothetical protein H5410_010734 [Solanum commersonii]|uniref:F-box/LRR-repeat protein 15/At3g58940/PEG3-like LRR domain-containing protein n=1 Tax=Solanum commersonii TaxID=4109 RepID=A0A9J6AMD3_SOLCO|nr:hypothetical protein H5410_010734 [Solanum commersonii]